MILGEKLKGNFSENKNEGIIYKCKETANTIQCIWTKSKRMFFMSRLQSIENALIEINETVFQELCDSYLVLRNPNYAAFSRTGSQSGKQKTTYYVS